MYLSSLSKTLNTFYGVLNSSEHMWRQIAKGASAFRWLRALVESWSASAIQRSSVKHGYLLLHNTCSRICISHVAGAGRTLQTIKHKTVFCIEQVNRLQSTILHHEVLPKATKSLRQVLDEGDGPPEICTRDKQAEPPLNTHLSHSYKQGIQGGLTVRV